MKRILLAVALVLFPSVLFAQAPDRDMLLTPEGTLYSLESVSADKYPELKMDGSTVLALTIQDDNGKTTALVPGSLEEGTNTRPALAYDRDTDTLFAFWLRVPYTMSGELLFSSYHAGQWTPVSKIDDAKGYHSRSNLRIGVTHKVATLQFDGTYFDVAKLVLHAVWWEESGNGSKARYALLPIENGSVSSVEIHDLSEFLDLNSKSFPADDSFNPEILRHPAIIEGSNSVDIIFGDVPNHLFNRITLKPVAEGRIHIPVGRREGDPRVRQIAAPASFKAPWTGRITTIVKGDGMVLYNVSPTGVNYLILSDNGWSTAKTIATSETVSADAAINAISKIAGAE